MKKELNSRPNRMSSDSKSDEKSVARHFGITANEAALSVEGYER